MKAKSIHNVSITNQNPASFWPHGTAELAIMSSSEILFFHRDQKLYL